MLECWRDHLEDHRLSIRRLENIGTPGRGGKFTGAFGYRESVASKPLAKAVSHYRLGAFYQGLASDNRLYGYNRWDVSLLGCQTGDTRSRATAWHSDTKDE